MVMFTHMLILPAASRSCFDHSCCQIAPSLSVLEFKWHAEVITVSGLRFKVSHGVSLVPALRWDGRPERAAWTDVQAGI